MKTFTIPSVQFTPQAVVGNFPNELHEAIVVTPELIEFAKAALPRASQLRDEAKGFERIALSASRGEGSWRRNGGPKKSIKADNLVHIVNLLTLLSSGKNANSWDGWIDHTEWNSIVEAIN